MGKGILCLALLGTGDLDHQLLSCKESLEAGTYGEGEDSGTITGEDRVFHQSFPRLENSVEHDYCAYQPDAPRHQESAGEEATGTGTAQCHEAEFADPSGAGFQPGG